MATKIESFDVCMQPLLRCAPVHLTQIPFRFFVALETYLHHKKGNFLGKDRRFPLHGIFSKEIISESNF